MIKIKKFFNRIKIVKFLASIKITCFCLLALFLLTFFGTVAQVQDGLYQAVAKYFHSWYFLALGFIPVPGAKLILWIFFINLLCVSITRFVYRLSHLGIVVTHIGLLSYFVAAFVTFNVAVESNVTLLEGESTNVSTAYHQWEISIWPETDSDTKEISAFDIRDFTVGDTIDFKHYGIKLNVRSNYAHSKALLSGGKEDVLNSTGIGQLMQEPLLKEPEKNIPGVQLKLANANHPGNILLYGADPQPTRVEIDGTVYNFQLRRKRFELPITIKLIDFQREMHPGTNVAKSFKSYVDITHDGVKREVLIFMNNPFRYKDYTFYQASYSIDQMGRERSTFAVVKNSGWLLPYISSLITFIGLCIHFLMMAFARKKEK